MPRILAARPAITAAAVVLALALAVFGALSLAGPTPLELRAALCAALGALGLQLHHSAALRRSERARRAPVAR